MKSIVTLAVLAGLSVTPVCLEHKLQKELPDGLCRQMVAHVPDADVAYQPGVDVHGKPVVGADVDPPAIEMPARIAFNISIDMAEYLGVNRPPGSEGYASLGTVVYENGVLTFNGAPLSGEAEAALREICTTPPAQKQPVQKDKEINHNKD